MTTRKILQWVALGALTVAVLLVIAAAVIVHTEKFQRFVLREIEQKTQSAIGARLEISRMAINWRALSFDFYAIKLHGQEIAPQPPLFSADHLRVGLKIVSILRRKVDLSEIVLDQPVVHVHIDSDGHSNLPRSKTKPETSTASFDSSWKTFLDMAIGRVEINSGQIYYNDRETPLSAEMRDFRTQINFSLLKNEYHGTLAYGNGVVVMKNFQPIAHGLQLNFTAGREGMDFDPLKLTAGRSTVTAHAKVTNLSNPNIDGTYDGTLSTTEIGQIIGVTELPGGEIALGGKVRYQNAIGKPVIENLYVDGTMNSGQLVTKVGRIVATARSLGAEYQLQNGDLHVGNVRADFLGGRIEGNYDMSRVGQNSSSRLEARARNISLAALEDTAAAQHKKPVRLSGRLDATLGATWSSRIQDGAVKSHIVIRNPNQLGERDSTIPLNGLIDIAYDGPRSIVSVGKSYLRAGNTTITASGTLSDRSRLETRVNVADLQEISALAAAFAEENSVSTSSTSISSLGLKGSARFNGQMTGSVNNPRITGELVASDFEVKNTKWKMLQTNLNASPSELSLQDGSLLAATQGKIGFAVRAALNRWSFSRSSPLTAQLTADQISITDIEQAIQANYPISGVMAADISVQGSMDSPTGKGSIQISKASAWNEPIDKLNFNFQGDGNSIRSTAEATTSAGSLTVNATYQPKAKAYEVDLRAPTIKLDQVQAPALRQLNLGGNLGLFASGKGTLDDPQLTVNLKIPELSIRGQMISDVQGKMDFANQRAAFTIDSKVDRGFIQSKGNVELKGQYQTNASLDARGLPISVLLAKYISDTQKVQGETEFHVTLDGPLKDPASLVARLEVPTLSVSYQSTSLALARPLRITYRRGLATIEQAEFKGTGTNLSIQGAIPIKSAAPLSVSANGTVDLAILQGFATGVRSSGRIDLNMTARGDMSHPSTQGKIQIVSASLSTESIPVGIETLNAEIQMTGNRLEIVKFAGSAGGGSVSARGFMTYGSQSAFNMGLDLKSVRVRYPQGIRSILSGNLALNGTSVNSQLTGRMLIDRLSFTQQFDLGTFLGQFSTDAPTGTPSAFERNMHLNVAVSSAAELNLASSKVSIGGAANLTVTGSLASPVILGRTTLNSGDMFFMGKRYEIQSGTIEFANPVRTTPVVNLYVKTRVQQYDITLNFVGPLRRLRTNYISDPPLPPADIINLVAFGKTSEQAATSPSTPPALGAESVLAGEVAGRVSGKLENLTGISQLTIDPSLGGSQSNPGARVAIQQRVTGNILLTFSTDVTSTENQAIQLQYQLNKSLSISVLRDEFGGYAADVRVHKTF